MEYERITCEQVNVGDRIARAKTHEFMRILAIDELPVARRLHFKRDVIPGGPATMMDNWRPRRTTPLWRKTDA